MFRALRSTRLYACLLLTLLIAGCSQTQPGNLTEPLVRHSSVHGGQQPISGATLTLYAVGTTSDGSASTSLMTTPVTSDASGNFSLTGAYTCPSPTTLVYVVATGGNPGLSAGTNNTAIALMTALGQCGNLGPATFITINELTTVSAVWPLAPFMTSFNSIGSGTSDSAALTNAFALASQYANTSTGTAPGSNVPPGTTVPIAQLNTLADILSSCVNSAGGVAGDGSPCGTLFTASTPTGGTAPTNVSGAGLNIANNPTANISTLHSLVTPTAPFQPTLSSPPADWTVGLAAPAGLSVSPTALTFPAGYLNFPATQALTVTNNGTTASNFANYLSVNGAAASDFSLGPCSLNAYGYLSAGASCQMQVTFNPSAVGPRNATLLFSGGLINAPLSIPRSGSGLSGTGGPITLSPSSLTFTLAGVSQPVTVTNYGTTPVAIGSITLTTSSGTTKFAETDNCGSTVPAQSICTISVQAVTMNTNLHTPNTQSTGVLTLIDSDPSGKPYGAVDRIFSVGL